MKLRILLPSIFFSTVFAVNITYARHHEMKSEYRNIIRLTVINLTGEDGYIGTCTAPIKPDGRTLCSMPQKIDQNVNTIFVPAYRKSYPIFSNKQDDVYKCATKQNPNAQRYFIINKDKKRHYTITLHGFLFDKDGNKQALICELPN